VKEITEFGRQLLAGNADWIHSSGNVDIWLGGVHLSAAEARWRWNNDSQTLISQDRSPIKQC
jgi:hypothetical protein